MKNFKKINLAVATLAVASAMAPVSVFAADTVQDKAEGKADITFQGDTGKMTLDQVPTFEFGTKKIADLTKADGLTFNTDGTQSIKVTNLTGSDDLYTVTANADTLKNGDKELNMASFLFSADSGTANSFGGKITGSTKANILGNDVTVATGDKNANGSLESGKTSAILNLSTNNVKNGTYTGKINYTLTSGPASTN